MTLGIGLSKLEFKEVVKGMKKYDKKLMLETFKRYVKILTTRHTRFN